MTTWVLTRQQVQELDRLAVAEYGLSGLVLMENAGRGCADTMCRLGIQGRVVICCGRGNNAGDGFVMARHLDLRGHAVRVWLVGDPRELGGDAAANHAVLVRSGADIQSWESDRRAAELSADLNGAEWVVDALLGTGAHGAPRPPLDEVIRRMNASPARRLAVDVPSGLDCDTGAAADPTVRADHTCTFVAPKPGLMSAAVGPYVGQLHILDIGAPRKLIEQFRG